MRRYCKPCNRFVPRDTSCRRCEDKLDTRLAEIEARELWRQANRQVWARCHTCWNLHPVCTCPRSGSIVMPEPEPAISAGV